MVQPTFPLNVGYVARVMSNFGLSRLFLVEPHFEVNEAIKYASHGADVLKNAEAISMRRLRERIGYLVGTTARCGQVASNIARRCVNIRRAASRMVQYEDPCILLGRDTTGLTNEETRICDWIISIKTGTTYGTLNISHALAIILYQLSVTRSLSRQVKAPTWAIRRRAVNYAEQLGSVAGFPREKLHLLRDASSRIFSGSIPREKEVRIMMMLMRDAILAIKRRQP
jgi:tRNA/rRNA methyltransferase